MKEARERTAAGIAHMDDLAEQIEAAFRRKLHPTTYKFYLEPF